VRIGRAEKAPGKMCKSAVYWGEKSKKFPAKAKKESRGYHNTRKTGKSKIFHSGLGAGPSFFLQKRGRYAESSTRINRGRH